MAAVRSAVVVLDGRRRDLIELVPIPHQHVDNLVVFQHWLENVHVTPSGG